MKLFVPAVGYRICLTSDWTFDLYREHRNETLRQVAFPESEKIHGRLGSVTMPSGTVLEVDRVYVRTINKRATSRDEDYDSLTFKVISHPTYDAKKKIRFWAKLDDVNRIEYELPPDHTAGKDKARAKATKPKKLDVNAIRDIVMGSFWSLNRLSAQSWMNHNLKVQLFRVISEYERLEEPAWRQSYETQKNEYEVDLKKMYLSGGIYLTSAQLQNIKSFDDVLALKPFHPYSKRQYTAAYVMHAIVYGTCSTAKSPDGGKVRTIRHPKRQDYYWNKNFPDMSHFWVRVTSDPMDTEIVSVEVGFDEVQS